MIEKGQSVHKKSIKRILEVDEKSKQVNFLDSRFYKRNENYYPSVTSILQYFPKGKFFENWLKDVGHNSDIIVKKAADEGTQTHSLIERYLTGEKIDWLDEKGHAICSLSVWQMLLKFVEFWTTEKPELVESEIHLFSDIHKIAGTCDLVVRMRDELWVLDIKTSNSVHTSYDLQLAAYTTCWNETFEEKVTKTGIIWLKSSKQKADKKGEKIQGKGWEVITSDRSIEENWNLFNKVYDLYKLENPKQEPSFNQFPISVQLDS
jgi:ATP-dependent exoDNAse (exonuclease V) beta subunit